MKVLFVCLGNICRSPTADGVFRHMIQEAKLHDTVIVDSAGTGGWHEGEAPDPRTIKAAAKRGYDLSKLRARKVSKDDFHTFDLIFAMDNSNLRNLEAIRPKGSKAELHLFLKKFGLDEEEVPDPYYGGADGFDHVLDLVEKACLELLKEVKAKLVKKEEPEAKARSE